MFQTYWNKKVFGTKLYECYGYIDGEIINHGDYKKERLELYITSPHDVTEEIDGNLFLFKESSIQVPDFLFETLLLNEHFQSNSITQINLDKVDLQNIAVQRDISEYVLNEEFYSKEAISEKRFLDKTRVKINKAAKENGGFFDWMILGTKYRVPLAPFLQWAENSALYTPGSFDELDGLNPYYWTPFLEKGWKMKSDDAYHSDWMLGAGLDFSLIWDSEYSREFTNMKFKKINEFLSTKGKKPLDALTLNGTDIIIGEVKFFSKDEVYTEDDIVIIPDSGIEYFELAKKVRCIITKTGGPLSHLGLNAQEYGINAILYLDADKLETGVSTRINLSKMTIVQGKNTHER